MKRVTLVAALAVAVSAALATGVASSTGGSAATSARQAALTDKAVFFAADGLRQDIVARYARQGLMPTMARFLGRGTYASGNGLLTQAPPNTGAGWYSLATGAWPGVHGSTNNTFHRNGQPFANRTAAFDPGVLQAESIAQSAERSGLKVAQVEWAGGRNATTQGPTIDFRAFFSGRGVATNFIGEAGEPLFDDVPFIQSFGLQFDHPAGHAGQPPFPGAAPTPATGWSGSLPRTYSPAREMRLRVLDFGTDKYGLNAWIFDSTNDRRVNYDKVLFSRTKSASDSVGVIAEGQWADVKVKIADGPSAGLTAGMLVRVEELAPNLSRVRLFHTSVSRALATWPNWPGASGFTGDFAEYLAQKFKTSTAADFAVLEAGVVSEETYVDQGLYWSRAHLPMLEYVVKTYRPDLLLVGMPTTDEFQHQFLGLVSPRLPGGAPNPAYDDVFLDGTRDRRVQAREGFIRSAYREADETLTLARELMGGGSGGADDSDDGEDDGDDPDAGGDADSGDDDDASNGDEDDGQGDDDRNDAGSGPTTFVSSDHGFAPQFLAIDASQAARRPRPALTAADVELPPCDGRDDRQGEGVLGRRRAADLPQRRRSRSRRWRPPAGRRSGRRRDARLDRGGVRRPRRPERLDARRPARGLEARSTASSRRRRPATSRTDRAPTTDMAHPTRTGDLVVFSLPPYQFDAATPGTLVSPSHFFGQHGYVPDVQDLSANVNMRATFLAGGERIARGRGHGPLDRPGPDPGVPARHRRAAAQSGTGPARRRARRQRVSRGVAGRAQRLPRPARPDDARVRRDQPAGRRRGVPCDALRRGARLAPPAVGAHPRRRRQRRRLASELRAARGPAGDRRRERVGPRRDVVRQP